MVPGYGTEYEENPSSHHGGMHEDGLPDRRTDGLTDVNKSTTFFSEISQHSKSLKTKWP